VTNGIETLFKEWMMKLRNMENRLAVLAAVIVLIGVSSAAENALADENPAAGLETGLGGTTSVLIAGQD
jgi:hypothetical protein